MICEESTSLESRADQLTDVCFLLGSCVFLLLFGKESSHGTLCLLFVFCVSLLLFGKELTWISVFALSFLCFSAAFWKKRAHMDLCVCSP